MVVKKICNILITIILIVMVITAGILLVPHLFGYKTYAVLSGSMENQYHVGSMVFVKPASAEEVKVDDVISFYLSGETVATHRVIAINSAEKTFQTKGDANEVADENPVSFNSLIGRVSGTSVPYLGYFSIYIKTKQGIISGVCLILTIILLSILPELFTKEESAKSEGRKTV